MISKKISPDVITFSALIYGFCAVGQLKEAFGLFHEMLLKNINPDVYTFSILVDALCKEDCERPRIGSREVEDGVRVRRGFIKCLLNLESVMKRRIKLGDEEQAALPLLCFA
ncbi:hypothetical protein P8452_51044 [Trifolium repens]|nr:hypothetical protein P8452_51044 [Trifolium repens]